MTRVMPTAPLQAVRGSGEAAAAPNPVRRPCLDFARSPANSSQLAEFAGTGLTFVPFACSSPDVITRFFFAPTACCGANAPCPRRPGTQPGPPTN